MGLIGNKIVTGEAMAKAVCNRLVERSCKFTMTPLPDDLWEFEVRSDSMCVLDDLQQACGPGVVSERVPLDGKGCLPAFADMWDSLKKEGR